MDQSEYLPLPPPLLAVGKHQLRLPVLRWFDLNRLIKFGRVGLFGGMAYGVWRMEYGELGAGSSSMNIGDRSLEAFVVIGVCFVCGWRGWRDEMRRFGSAGGVYVCFAKPSHSAQICSMAHTPPIGPLVVIV
jgi:hypothetical protein